MKTRLDTREFESTRKKYMEFTRRDMASVMNTKLFYIARGATRETKKADKKKMLAELRSKRIKNTLTKMGKTKQVKATLAQLIIWKRRADAGESVKKKDMREDVKSLIAARIRSISFLKSGWLPSIKKLAPFAEKIGGAVPRVDKSAIQIGKDKGTAKPAKPSKTPTAMIRNDALPNGRSGFWKSLFSGNRAQAMKYALPGLQAAFDKETRSMKEYIERKLTARAKRLAIKTR